jgi:signal transduction histidine kinase
MSQLNTVGPRRSAPESAAPATVLVVDDNGDVTQIVTMMLQHGGYKVLAAGGGAEALAVLEQHRPDLILCDILMPDMDGMEVFRRVRADRRWRSIPFVFLTALHDAQTRLTSSEMGAEGFIGKPFGLRDLLSTVSGLIRRAQELQDYSADEVESLKSGVMYMVTHELNTPLSVLRMLTETLRTSKRRLTPEQSDQYYELLGQSVNDLTYVVDSMLLGLQIEAGRAQRSFEMWAAPLSLARAARDAVNRAGARAAELGVTIETGPQFADARVMAHEDHLRQILGRVLDNAIRFSPRGGTVAVRVEGLGDAACVTISDQGPGMTPDEVESAFDRLHQIGRAEREQQGLGLSLSMVKALTAIHGGQITVESAPGRGSAFTICLPLVATLPSRAAPAEEFAE